MRKLSFILFLMPFLLSCKDPNYKEIPDKPPNVPDSAIWIGGTKGGTFIDCKYAGEKRFYNCDAYAETGSQLLKNGKYELKYAIWNDKQQSVDYYDLNDTIIPSAYHEIYIMDNDIELGGRLVLKPIAK